MSEATLEATESEAYEAVGEAAYEGEAVEAAYEGESAGEAAYEAWGEDARSDTRRRARQRQVLAARQRQAQLRRPSSPPPRRMAITVPAPSQAVREVRSEVRSLDLDTKVALDSLRSRLSEANRLAYRNAWAAEASVAASQVLDSFRTGLDPHDWARALIRGAPTLVLAPGKPRRPGLEGVLFDPRVAGGAVIAAIFAIGHFRGVTHGVNAIKVTPPSVKVKKDDTVKLFAEPVDQKGNTVANVDLTWNILDDAIASLDTTTGPNVVCTGKGEGKTRITVKGGGVTERVRVTVTVP